MLNKVLDKAEIKRTIESLRDEIINSSVTGQEYYKDLISQYSEKGYNVKITDMVPFKGPELDMVFLTAGKLYSVVDTEDVNGIKNAKIEVIDDRRKRSWHPAERFGLKLINLEEGIRKYVLKKIIESLSCTVATGFPAESIIMVGFINSSVSPLA